MIHFEYIAIAALSSILTAIPIFIAASLLGSNHTASRQPQSEPESEPTPEPWKPTTMHGAYHWERTSEDENDPYGWKFVRDDDEVTCG